MAASGSGAGEEDWGIYGRVIGRRQIRDIIGSPYEFDRGNKSKDFPLFSGKSIYTDDTVIILAVRHAAKLSAEVTHNHPEGIKGAEVTASVIFLARTGHSKAEIKEYIVHEFGYALNGTCDEIRPGYFHTKTCMETVPEAITAFLEGDSFEDVIRTAVSLGGDCDTLTAIVGSNGFYGVPAELKEECYKLLPEPLLKVLKAFEEYLDEKLL